MKILPIKKVLQSSNSKIEDLEYVEYYEEYNSIDCIMELKQHIPTWCVNTDRTHPQFNLNQSNFEFMDWLIKKEADIIRINEKLVKNNSNIRIDGIYLYDIGSCLQQVCMSDTETVDAINFYPRYDYIKNILMK